MTEAEFKAILQEEGITSAEVQTEIWVSCPLPPWWLEEGKVRIAARMTIAQYGKAAVR
jgi:hypothetical protein